MESIYKANSRRCETSEDESNNKKVSFIVLPSKVELIFDRSIDNQSLITVKLSKKLKFILRSSLYSTYFQYLLVTRKSFKLSDYVRESKLGLILKTKRILIKNFFTAKTRFLDLFKECNNEYLTEIGKLLKHIIHISNKNKKEIIGFNETSETRIISKDGFT